MYRDIVLQNAISPSGRFRTEAPNKLWDMEETSEPMMSDTLYERQTNQIFLDSAKGDVLILGLGIGLIVYPIMNKANVTSIKIVELHQEVIDLILPQRSFN